MLREGDVVVDLLVVVVILFEVFAPVLLLREGVLYIPLFVVEPLLLTALLREFCAPVALL